MSPFVIATIFVSVVLTSFISGILGMAGGMILMGVLLALLPLTQAMLLHGMVQMAANGWRAWLWRAHIAWPATRYYILGALLALGALMLLRLVVSKPVGFIVIGCTPFITMLLPKKMVLNIDKPTHAGFCGLASSCLQLTGGVSGPVLDSFFIHSALNKHGIVATKAITQSFGHMLKIAYFGGFASIISSTATPTSAPIAPWIIIIAVALAFVGTNLSRRILDGLDEAKFRSYTRTVISVIGAGYLTAGLLMLLNSN